MSESLKDQPKCRFYGSKAALTCEATTSRDGLPTANLEVAPRSGKEIDWHRKITLQLADSEMPVLCCVLLGFLPRAHFKRPDKGIEIERQSSKVLIRASAGAGNLFLLPVAIGDTFRLSAFLMGQLKQQNPYIDDNGVLAALRGAASLYKTS